MMRVEVLGGVERRRRWSHDEKRRINNMTDFEVWHMEGNGGDCQKWIKWRKWIKTTENMNSSLQYLN